METVTRYLSNDGELFDTEEKCIAHEARIAAEDKLDDDLCLRHGVEATDVIAQVIENRELLRPLI